MTKEREKRDLSALSDEALQEELSRALDQVAELAAELRARGLNPGARLPAAPGLGSLGAYRPVEPAGAAANPELAVAAPI